MSLSLEQELRSIIDFDRVIETKTIQSLWSGYGSISRLKLSGYKSDSVIVKHISPPTNATHPRGWNTDVGHQRKLKSYEVEAYWYAEYNHRTTDKCRTPSLLGIKRFDTQSMLVLEDLNAAGFSVRKSNLNKNESKNCLDWLAHFHAEFMCEKAEGLWKIGTYWHLETRQNEWKSMAASKLKENAQAIHEKLNNAKYQTLVHGDAKYANFCFSEGDRVAAVDFQYVGKGCGIKDVAYLLSCIEQGIASEELENELLTHYFKTLKASLLIKDSLFNVEALEQEWRSLYPFAWADLERFLQGWSPGHWKLSAYSQNQVQKALRRLG